MLIPCYFFKGDYRRFYRYFLTKPHQKIGIRHDYVWKSQELNQKICYIVSGIAQNYIEHEDGYKKMIAFHGKGAIFPYYHRLNFKMEKNMMTRAVTDMDLLMFDKNVFGKMIQENFELNIQVINSYAAKLNLQFYENAHQRYNNSFVKLCNLLYLLFVYDKHRLIFNISQSNIADILGISRVHLTRGLNKLREENIILTRRKQIEIIKPLELMKYCSLETVEK